MFKSIIFSKVFKHEANCGKGSRRKMTVPGERTRLECDKVICLPGLCPVGTHSRFMAWEGNWHGL